MCILFDLLFSSSSNNKAVQAKSLNENCLNVALIAWIHHNQQRNEWYRKILSFLSSYMGKIEDGNWIILNLESAKCSVQCEVSDHRIGDNTIRLTVQHFPTRISPQGRNINQQDSV
jgi:hypothetical protein